MNNRPYALSIAGFDPSGGAGVLSDIKTFEGCGVQGFGVVSALTYQNDIRFDAVEWVAVEKIIRQVDVLLDRFEVRHFKVGLIESLYVLEKLVAYLKTKVPDAVIIYDPILKASAGFEFHSGLNGIVELLPELGCITPNIPESVKVFGKENLMEKLHNMSNYCPVYLKGGHDTGIDVVDILINKGIEYDFSNARLPLGEKHGSGCVLSSSLAAYLAVGNDILCASGLANRYTNKYLASSETLLGQH